MDAKLLRGAAHITGGGITDNTPRMLPKDFGVAIDTGAWKIPPLFEVLRRIGNIPEDDYRRTLNLGVGMILGGARARGELRRRRCSANSGETPFRIGSVVEHEARAPARGVRLKRLGILISGRGSNFEAIARQCGAARSTSTRRSRW